MFFFSKSINMFDYPPNIMRACHVSMDQPSKFYCFILSLQIFCPQLVTFPAFRSRTVTALSFPQLHRHIQQVLPFLFSVRYKTVRVPKTRPVRSSATFPLWAVFFPTHPQSFMVPLTRCLVFTRISCPQLQMHR